MLDSCVNQGLYFQISSLMAYPVEGKGHGGNRLMCSPRGDSLSLSLSLSRSLSPSPLGPRQTVSVLRHPHLPPTAHSPARQDFNHRAKWNY